MVVKDYDILLSEMKNHMIANQTKITDFNKGSVIMTIFEAVSRIVERIYIETRNGYIQNLKAIPYSVFGFEKKAGIHAQAKVVFSRSQPIAADTMIPIGTVVSSGVYEFATTENAVIKNGEISSNAVFVTAAEAGIAYNVGAGEISQIETTVPSDVVEVTNEAKAYGGTDEESDSDMLARFKLYINGLQGGSLYAVKSAVLNIDGVRSCSVYEHFPLKQGVYNATLYIDDGTGNLSTQLKNTVLDKINGDDTSVNPGVRAAGINIDVSAPTQVPVNIAATVKIYRTEKSLAESDVTEAMKVLVNGLGIGEDVLLTDIILKMRSISYVKDVSNLKINDEIANITITDDQIARLGTLTIEFVSE